MEAQSSQRRDALGRRQAVSEMMCPEDHGSPDPLQFNHDEPGPCAVTDESFSTSNTARTSTETMRTSNDTQNDQKCANQKCANLNDLVQNLSKALDQAEERREAEKHQGFREQRILLNELRTERRAKKEAQRDFWNERYHRDRAENLLEVEQRLRETAESKLKEKEAESLKFEKLWRKVARELSTMRSQQQQSNITDNYLVERANGLRYSIQTFAVQYYGEDSQWIWGLPEMDDSFVHMLTSVPNLKEDLMSGVRRWAAIQVVIWRVLVDSIFNSFAWVDSTINPHASALCNILRPEWHKNADYPGSRDPAVERKFQIWNASTSALLAELVDAKSRAREIDTIAEGTQDTDIFKMTWSLLNKLPTPHNPQGLTQALRQIFQDAIALDKEINKQVARIEWDFPKVTTGVEFDPRCMTMTKTQEREATTDEVRLVIAPRILKRGKSDGTEFGTEIQLLPMEVCLMPAPNSGGGLLSTVTNYFHHK